MHKNIELEDILTNYRGILSERQRNTLYVLYEKTIKSATKVLSLEASESAATGSLKEHFRMLKELQIRITELSSDDFNEQFEIVKREINEWKWNMLKKLLNSIQYFSIKLIK